MTIVEAFFLGIIEGFTEFLPISSTAHLLIGSRLLGLDLGDEFLKTFIIAIQLGAILAVATFFIKKVYGNRALLRPILAAFIPTAIFGFVFYKLIKGYLLENIWIPVIALFLGGIVLILFDRYFKNKTPRIMETSSITLRDAAIIGCSQALAIIPGVSRSGATIVAGLLLGIEKTVIVEFSFLLALPTMLAAVGYDVLKNIETVSTFQNFPLLAVGFLTAFLSALLAMRFLIQFVKDHSFTMFGVYRIIFALFAAAIFI